MVNLIALIDVEAGEELTCLASLIVLCNIAGIATVSVCVMIFQALTGQERVAATQRCISCVCDLLEAEYVLISEHRSFVCRHPLLQSRTLRLLRELIRHEIVQTEVSELPSFRRGLLAALNSHNAGVIEDATFILSQAISGEAAALFSGDNLLRDALVCSND